jgi:hypothetical protein
MSSGVSKTRVGAFNGTGAVVEVRGVEFRPRKVELYNVTGLATAVWVEGMADDSALKEVTAGTKSLITSAGVTPRSDGFDLGADADLNVSAELVRWVAHE